MKLTPLELEDLQRRLARNRDPAAAKAKEQQEKAVKTEKWASGQERELNRQFCSWLTMKGVPHIVARTDRKSTIGSGWPDVTALYGMEFVDGEHIPRVCCVELKCEGGKLSVEQKKCHSHLRAVGIPVLVAYNLADALAFVKEHLRL